MVLRNAVRYLGLDDVHNVDFVAAVQFVGRFGRFAVRRHDKLKIEVIIVAVARRQMRIVEQNGVVQVLAFGTEVGPEN